MPTTGFGRAVLAALTLAGACALDAPASRAASAANAPARAADAPQPRSAAAPPAADAPNRNVVARARILECGHQWNNMKRAGTASGTWKDFSRGCLAQR